MRERDMNMKTLRNSISMTVLVALALVVAGCAPATEEATEGGEMAKIEVDMKVELASSPDDVWKIVGGFGGVDWLGAVLEVSVEGEGIGAVRTLTLPEDGKVVETLDAHDDEAMSITYSIVESTLPIDNYTSTMTVEVNEDGKTEFHWASSFTAKGNSDEGAKIFVEHFYMGGFYDLKKALGEPVEEEESADEE